MHFIEFDQFSTVVLFPLQVAMANFLYHFSILVIAIVKTIVTSIMLLKQRFREIKQFAYTSRRHWSCGPRSRALSFRPYSYCLPA